MRIHLDAPRFEIGDPAIPAAPSLVHYRTDVVSKNNMHQFMGVIVAMSSLPSGLVTCYLLLFILFSLEKDC